MAPTWPQSGPKPNRDPTQVLAPPVVALLRAALERVLRAGDWRQPSLLLKAAPNQSRTLTLSLTRPQPYS